MDSEKSSLLAYQAQPPYNPVPPPQTYAQPVVPFPGGGVVQPGQVYGAAVPGAPQFQQQPGPEVTLVWNAVVQPLGPEDVRFIPNIEIPEKGGFVEIPMEELYENTHWITENKVNLVFTLGVFGVLGAFLWSVAAKSSAMLYLGIALGVVCLIYYIESIVSSTRKYLWTVTNPRGVHEYIRTIKDTPIRIVLHVECYHYETRYHTSTDSEGKTTTTTTTEKVVTYYGTEEFCYDYWDDISGQLLGVGELYRLTRVRFHRRFVFADQETQHAWEHQCRSFQHRHRHRDVEMTFWHTVGIHGYEPRLLAICGDAQDIPQCVGISWYSLCSLLFLGYFYRSWFHTISTRQSYEFIKRLKKHHHHHH
jgi:hypothetical protein